MGGAPSGTAEPTRQSSLPPSVPQGALGQVSGPLPAAVPGGVAGTMHRQARACPEAGGAPVAARLSYNAMAPA